MDRFRVFSELSSAGLGLVGAVLVGLWVGQWLDGLAGTKGLLMLLFLALGLAGGLINLVRTLQRMNAKD